MVLSDAPGPGWFPDQADPALERLWDGEAWTANTRPRRAPFTPPPLPAVHESDTGQGGSARLAGVGSSASGSRRIWLIVGFAAALLLVALMALQAIGALSLGGPSTVVSCERLASEAVRVSQENNAGSGLPVLLRVERPVVVSDTQATAKAPSVGEVTVLECRGTGYFSSTDVAPVRLLLTMDSDGNSWVAYESE